MVPKDHRRTAADMVAAAGYAAGVDCHGPSPTRLGMALLRLHSEWTACARPKRVGREVVESLADAIRLSDIRAKESARLRGVAFAEPGSPFGRANAEVQGWYTNELRLLALRLKSRAEVIGQLIAWGALKGIDPEVVTTALAFWMDDTCHHCHGHGLTFTDFQAAKRCKPCEGTGKTLERTQAVDRVLRHIDYALGMARGQLRERLKNSR